MKQFVAYEVGDFAYIAKELLKKIEAGTVIVFTGDMGAGKTTFVQYILKGMGIEELEGSPTYPIVLMYESVFFGSVAHIDVYRLASIEEAINVGLEELFYNGTLCLVEWGERVADLLPLNYLEVKIEINDVGHRLVEWEERQMV